MVAAYALALQALLGAVSAGQAAVTADPFVICLAGDDGAPGHGGGKSQTSHDCQLCTLAKGFHAVLGAGEAAAPADFVFCSIVMAPAIARVVSYDSPTGQYQRGPPGALSAG